MRKDTVYISEGKELPVEVLIPDAPRSGRLPCCVFIYGGGWMTGKTAQWEEQGEVFAEDGAAVFIPTYRTYRNDGVTVETCLCDVRNFLSWLGRNIDTFGIDRDRVLLGGGSAGAHLALMALLSEDRDYGFRPRCLMFMNPVVDTKETGFQSKALLEAPVDPVSVSPIDNLGPLPECFMMAGTADTVAPYESIVRFERESRKLGNSVELVTLPGRKHGFYNRGRSENDEDYFLALGAMRAFMKRTILS